MKKHKDLLYTFFGISIIVLLVFVVYHSNKPDSLTLDLDQESQRSEENQLVLDALQHPETAIRDAEGKEPLVVKPVQVTEPQAVDSVWRESAQVTDMDNLGRIELEGRDPLASENSFSGLRQTSYTEPRSQENRKVVQALLEKRKQSVKEY